MATVNLDKSGYLINIVNAHTPGPSITFLYNTMGGEKFKRRDCYPVSGIFVGGDAVVTIHYNHDNGSITGVFPGSAANKVNVNIG